MSLFTRVDEWCRARVHALMMRAGSRFGWRRNAVAYQLAWSIPFLSLISSVGVDRGFFSSVFWSGLSFLANGLVALGVYVRGTNLLRSGAWGVYANWREWRWLRMLEILTFPIMLSSSVLRIAGGDVFGVATVLRNFAVLTLLYVLAMDELPPRKPRESREAKLAPEGLS